MAWDELRILIKNFSVISNLFGLYFKVFRTYLLGNGLIKLNLILICLFLSKRDIIRYAYQKCYKIQEKNDLEGAKFVGISAGKLFHDLSLHWQ